MASVNAANEHPHPTLGNLRTAVADASVVKVSRIPGEYLSFTEILDQGGTSTSTVLRYAQAVVVLAL